MLADVLGRPIRFIVTAGQGGDITQAPALLSGQAGAAAIADKAYDSNTLRALIAQMGAEVVIPCNPTRKVTISNNTIAYRLQATGYRLQATGYRLQATGYRLQATGYRLQATGIERRFNRLKHFRRFVTRYNRLTIHFLGFVHLVSAMIWMA